MITSTAFMDKAVRWYQPEYFTDYARLIADWCVKYYQEYRQAPGKHIQNIYAVEKEDIKPALAANVATYLQNLSAQYEERAEFNLEYMADTGMDFFKRRGYEHLFTTGRELMMAGRIDDAMQLHHEFRSVAKHTTGWENPFDPGVIREHFSADEEAYVVLRFRGALGQLLGPQERGWLIAFMGPPKGGKSFWAQETMFAAAVQGKRVAYINLEMTKRGMKGREYKRLTAMPDNQGRYIMPVFDCYHNQSGECTLATRLGTGTIMNDKGDVQQYHVGNPVSERWTPCTECRNDPAAREEYSSAVWYSTMTQKGLSEEEVMHQAKGFQLQFGDRIRHISYPAFSATIDDIRFDLDELIYTERFFPDVVVLDYADILATDGRQEERHRLNEIWKHLKRSAGDMHNLWVTATQTNREGIGKSRIDERNAAEDIRKIANVDAIFGLNRSKKEKERETHYTRVNVVANRHREFAKRDVAVLHQLSLGMPYVDSEWW
jgi:hypothetical protein